MESNYIVSIVFQKGTSFELVSGMIEAKSTYEAIGIAVQVKNRLGSIFLTSAIVCDETNAISFEYSVMDRNQN